METTTIKKKAPILELSTTDIVKSLNFLHKCDIVNDAFPWSCHLIGVEIVILDFSNCFCMYVFILRTLPKISHDVLLTASFAQNDVIR